MAEELIIVVLFVALAMALLSIRLLFGKKKFVHTHVEGNPEMERRGIGCVKSQDRQARQRDGFKIKEHSGRERR